MLRLVPTLGLISAALAVGGGIPTWGITSTCLLGFTWVMALSIDKVSALVSPCHHCQFVYVLNHVSGSGPDVSLGLLTLGVWNSRFISPQLAVSHPSGYRRTRL